MISVVFCGWVIVCFSIVSKKVLFGSLEIGKWVDWMDSLLCWWIRFCWLWL